jgi:TetR/AcrR family transcriptional repressor of nem operon
MRKGNDTREMIIRKSAELFNVYGYHGCSLSDIMKATSLKKGGIYNHFANKDEIAIAAFDHSFQKILARFRERLDKDTTGTEKLYSIVAVFRDMVTNPVIKGGCPMVNTAIDSTDSHPELKKRAKNAVQTLESYIVFKIEEGKTSGEFRTDADSEDIASFMVMSLEGAVMMTRVNSNLKYISMASHHVQNYLKEHLFAH